MCYGSIIIHARSFEKRCPLKVLQSPHVGLELPPPHPLRVPAPTQAIVSPAIAWPITQARIRNGAEAGPGGNPHPYTHTRCGLCTVGSSHPPGKLPPLILACQGQISREVVTHKLSALSHQNWGGGVPLPGGGGLGDALLSCAVSPDFVHQDPSLASNRLEAVTLFARHLKSQTGLAQFPGCIVPLLPSCTCPGLLCAIWDVSEVDRVL